MKQIIVTAILLVCLGGITGCVFKEKGCTDITALNYNPNALADNGDCLYQLPLPDTYRFKRGDSSAVNYQNEVVYQLLTLAINQTIEQLAQPGAASVTLNDFTQWYQDTSHTKPIITPVPPFASYQATYSQIAPKQRLSASVMNTFNANTQLLQWFDTIATRSQNPALLGTPAVYTTAQGIDLSMAVSATLATSVFLANGVRLLSNISSNANNNLLARTNYTAMENAWDRAFGCFGAAIFYPLYPDDYWQNTPYADHNNDQLINFTQEYTFTFAALAAQRDGIGDAQTNFTETLFNAWLSGRTAITNKSDLQRSAARQTLLTEWQRLTAATAIHHLNALLIQLPNYGTPAQNLPLLNRHWTGFWVYLGALRYFNPPTANLTNLLALLGNEPVYAQPGSDAYNNYLTKLNQIKTALKTAYQFSDFQMDNF